MVTPEQIWERRQAFIELVKPAAIAAIGEQHQFLIKWAICKAGLESNWNTRNVLIVQGNNCLGIKHFSGDPLVVTANTGPETGTSVKWQRFNSLTACFKSLVYSWNRSQYYEKARHEFLNSFENIYAAGTPGHTDEIRRLVDEIQVEL